MQGSIGKTRRNIMVPIGRKIGRTMIRIIIIKTIPVIRGMTTILGMNFIILIRNRYFLSFFL